jgi:DNA-directed RNA polymerase subunit beta'
MDEAERRAIADAEAAELASATEAAAAVEAPEHSEGTPTE